jgi:hypothetical protein
MTLLIVEICDFVGMQVRACKKGLQILKHLLSMISSHISQCTCGIFQQIIIILELYEIIY